MLQLENSKAAKSLALLSAVSLVSPIFLAGCGGGAPPSQGGPPPPNMGARPGPGQGRVANAPRQGMSTKTKVALLVGAAALYYIYKKRQAKAESERGPEGKYFISKSTGRVYYRNLRDGSFQWVSPPRQAIRVPMEEAQEYSGYAGFNNNNSGRSFGGYGPGINSNYNDAEPAVWNQ